MIVDVVCALFHKYVNVPVPPLATALAVPLDVLHVACVLFSERDIAVGCVIVKLCVAVQRFASVTVTV